MKLKIMAALGLVIAFNIPQPARAGQSGHPTPIVAKVESASEFEGGPLSPDGTVVPREIIAIVLGHSGAVGNYGFDAGNPSQTGIAATFSQGRMSARMCDQPVWVYFSRGKGLDGSGLLYAIVPLAAAGRESCELVVQQWFEDGSTTASEPFEVKISKKSQDQALMVWDGVRLLPVVLQPDGAPMTSSNGVKIGDVVTIWGSGCGPAAGLFEYLYNPQTAVSTEKPIVSINGVQAEVVSAGFSTYYTGVCEYRVRIPASITIGTGHATMMIGEFGPYTMVIR